MDSDNSAQVCILLLYLGCSLLIYLQLFHLPYHILLCLKLLMYLREHSLMADKLLLQNNLRKSGLLLVCLNYCCGINELSFCGIYFCYLDKLIISYCSKDSIFCNHTARRISSPDNFGIVDLSPLKY